jgi:DNA-binding NarL/FixJ family response regulator
MGGHVRVVVVDDDVPTRVGIRAILTSEPGIDVVAEAGTGAEAIELCRTLVPDIVIMDVRLPDANGIAVAARILENALLARTTTRVIVLTTFADDRYAQTAMLAGASAFVVKRAPAEELLATVRGVAAGSFVDHRLDASGVSDSPSQRPSALTGRESDVLALMARGRSNEEISEALFLSLETVRSYIKRIYGKIGARDRADAVALAYESGLVRSQPPEP